MRIVKTLCASKPGFTCRIAMKVRISSAAPINSTTASAISVVTSSARVLLCRKPVPLRLPLSFSVAAQIRTRRLQSGNESKQNARQNR